MTEDLRRRADLYKESGHNYAGFIVEGVARDLEDKKLLPQRLSSNESIDLSMEGEETVVAEFSGAEVRRRRQELGLTQRDLAREAGTSQNQVYVTEAEKADIQRSTMEQTARALGGKLRVLIEYPKDTSKPKQ